MRKLILSNFQSPGDIVMLTAAVRDLHLCYPEQFLTDVRTPFPELWEHNPYLTELSEDDPDATLIHCEYPLIQKSNLQPYHFLHGFVAFLSDRLRRHIQVTQFKGDIHLSETDKAMGLTMSQLMDGCSDYWIIVAGGKYDYTIKWWDVERYQQVVDHFRGRVTFVQVGAEHDYHPRLEGVIDLRGKTNLRELIRLVYHAQGVLTPVSLPMHLAAAVETRPDRPKNRACVVVAGGREPPHWEAYPHHQFLHTCGALPCCEQGGCWRARAFPLGDGNDKDQPQHLCTNLVGALPRCMHMITAEEVVRRIELYYQGQTLPYVRRNIACIAEHTAPSGACNTKHGQAGGRWTDSLTAENAVARAETYIANIPAYPEVFSDRGIVVCGGGERYFPCAWVCINMLRHLGCRLPIQLWYLGPLEMDRRMQELVEPLGVTCVDARARRRQEQIKLAHVPWSKGLGGFELKPYAILNCPFQEVLLLDADNVPVVNPEFLFEQPQYRKTGAVFWPDYGRLAPMREIWDVCGVPYRDEPEFESGQILVDKARCWRALQLTMWYNNHSEFFYRYIHGDKDTFHLAFRKLGEAYSMPSRPIHPLEYTMCQHDFEGNRIFQHRNLAKWMLRRPNLRIYDFWYEVECLDFLKQLETKWNGQIYTEDATPVSFEATALQQVAETLTRKVYRYHRVGYDTRLMSFRSNGLVGQGAAGQEVYWDLLPDVQGPLLEIAARDRPTCLLKQEPTGVWKGRWLWYERMRVELIPA
jgi:ADP-heptose:LPS heptosyltransferase